jgi:nitrogenase molybdenum-iron protein alpha/beta subunit
MKEIWYYISYPIRLCLRKKVEMYRFSIMNHEFFGHHKKPKARRNGMTALASMIANKYFMEYLAKKAFVEKWEIKQKKQNR